MGRLASMIVMSQLRCVSVLPVRCWLLGLVRRLVFFCSPGSLIFNTVFVFARYLGSCVSAFVWASLYFSMPFLGCLCVNLGRCECASPLPFRFSALFSNPCAWSPHVEFVA